MADEEQARDTFSQEDHQVAFIFNPDEGDDARRERPTKRRKVSKGAANPQKEGASATLSPFSPLLDGHESAECVHKRQQLFEESWALVDHRIKGILRDSNSATLEQVSAFARDAKSECGDRIPSAFIITGPNIASQDLLFEQLSESLQRPWPSKFIRLRSSEAINLKAALKKIVRDGTSATSTDDGDDDLQIGQEADGRRYLNYDLEALDVFVRQQHLEHIFVAFQDSEGFDSSLLSDMIALLSSWRPRIPFTLLFGIATSIEFLQTRLLKSVCRMIYGAQFDCVQTDTILESVFRGAVVSRDVQLRIGAHVLRWMLDRQHDQMAGIQAFVSSLKYAYMCHFYANALSILPAVGAEAGADTILQAEHLEAVRHLPTFRRDVETSIRLGTSDSIEHARAALEDDEYLRDSIRASHRMRQNWVDDRLRSLLVVEAAGAMHTSFSRMYVECMTAGLAESGNSSLVDCVRKMSAAALLEMVRRVISIFREGEPSLQLGPASRDEDVQLRVALEESLSRLERLEADAQRGGHTLRTKYSGQNKVMRTTVIAQRVQLSRDSAALRDEDKQMTEIVDTVTNLLSSHFQPSPPESMLFSESWLYDSRSPLRNVMVPRPRAAFGRSLARPHDYLSCACCIGEEDQGDRDGGGIKATLPATSILYHLYTEAGNLINVADLWSAFFALVGQQPQQEQQEEADADEVQLPQLDERNALVLFYRGLAELRAMGFVKSSKKKADHVAKARWL